LLAAEYCDPERQVLWPSEKAGSTGGSLSIEEVVFQLVGTCATSGGLFDSMSYFTKAPGKIDRKLICLAKVGYVLTDPAPSPCDKSRFARLDIADSWRCLVVNWRLMA
jgi:hypothetical protein